MKKEKDRVLIIELRDAVWESACNRTLKKDYPLLLSLCRDAGISTYTLNLFIVTAQTKLKNPTVAYTTVPLPPPEKESEEDSVKAESIKIIHKKPIKYSAYKILFLSLLLVIVALWTGRSCGCTGNQRSEAADSKETDSTPKGNSIEESREDVASDSSTGCQFTAYGQKAAKETTAEIKYTKQHVTDGAENSNNNSGVKAPKSKDELFKEAKENNDYLTMKALADQGYVKAYIPLAQHYLKNKNTHGQAKEYAEKAQQASVPGANEILEELELLDY